MKISSGQTAVITGGASGIGLAVGRRLAAEGLNVVLADLDDARLADAADRLRADVEGAAVLTSVVDVAESADLERLADETLARFGELHLLFNNAGVVLGGRVEQLTEAEWRWVVDVNFWSVVHGIRTFLPILERQGCGHVISTASTQALVPGALGGPYNASKAAVASVMETLARELAARGSGVGASVLCPGNVRTNILAPSKHRPAGTQHEEASTIIAEAGRAIVAAGRAPEEIAEAVLEGVRRDRFWILTHPEWADVVRARTEAIVTTGLLTAARPVPLDLRGQG